MDSATSSNADAHPPARQRLRKRTVVLLGVAALVALLVGVGATQIPAALDGAARDEFGSTGATQEHIGQDRAQAMAAATPAGATVDAASNRVTFHTRQVRMTILAGPSGQEMTFRMAGLTNPTVQVPRDARVEIRLINGDSDKPHGWAVVAGGTSGDEPLRGHAPSVPGAAAMLFDHAATSGWPAQTITFSAPQPGHYAYLCQVGDHARMGMRGDFEVATG
ncbi:MAG: hypothetical protein J2P40_15935 [Candidatus Dormibacteraeota bacterium]|nr:hypothetical protein [Candidatus Dormibacteraeota bacterium]MBO0762764.1 hypothetical protein [Candidatus Dormibacteraeota bacterium]